MGAIEFREHDERLQVATRKLDGKVAKLRARVCPADATLLSEDGSCGVCGRRLTPPSVDLSTMTPQERKGAIQRGVVPPATEGLSEQEQKQAAFWQRYRAAHPDAQQAKPHWIRQTFHPSQQLLRLRGNFDHPYIRMNC